MTTLAVSEQFYSIQGEGQTVGRPAYFLRLTACNLLCGGYRTDRDKEYHDGATWRCDTIEVWQKGRHKTFDEIVKDFGGDTFTDNLAGHRARLVITGGEPLLQDQAIEEFVTYLNETCDCGNFTLEIETNGTILPSQFLLQAVDFWNCSPKLANSGMPKDKRIKPAVLMALTALHFKTIFKFVIFKRSDWTELWFDYYSFIDHKQIWLMPAADNDKALPLVSQLVAELCKEYGVNFSPRLHINIWNQKTGV